MKILIFICFAHGDMKIILKMGATQKYDTVAKLQKNQYVLTTSSIAEILYVKNGTAIVVCGILMK